jgi:predicted amidohydrolase
MMDELRICLIQADLAWENRNQNLAHLRQMAEQSPSAEVIVLPEMFASGFTMNAKACAEAPEGETVHWMKDLARAQNAAITGSRMAKPRLTTSAICLAWRAKKKFLPPAPKTF